MINSDTNPNPNTSSTVINTVPVGAYAPVFRSGVSYKAIGELVQRSIYTALSAAFPRNGSFTSVAGTLPASYCASIAFGNGVFVSVNTPVTPGVIGATNLVFVSVDGKNWATYSLPSAQSWAAITFGNGKFVAVASSGGAASNVVAYSTDGINWTQATMSASAVWQSITYGAGLFVAVSGSGTTSSNVSASSPDGITWTSSTLPTSGWWKNVVFANGMFLALTGTTTGAKSTNGTTWTSTTFPSSFIDVDYGNGIFVATGITGGTTGTVYTSPDGLTWTLRNIPRVGTSSVVYNSVVFGNGVFVCLSNSGSAIVSTDGINWSLKAAVTGVTSNGCYANGSFLFFYSDAITLSSGGTSSAAYTYLYAEDAGSLSDWMYLSGTTGQFVRVQ